MMEAQARRVLSLFRPRDPVIPGVILADLGLSNGTQVVQVYAEGSMFLAVYLPALAVKLPGNCFISRGSAGRLAVAFVVATNYQVPVRVGWGSGQDPWIPVGPWPGAAGPGDPGYELEVVVDSYFGWGGQPWGG
jgi:hypothetical protein